MDAPLQGIRNWTCRHCGKEFRRLRFGVGFCSLSCGNLARAERRGHGLRKKPRPCRHCGKEFIPKPNSEHKGLFCSRECAFAEKKKQSSILAETREAIRQAEVAARRAVCAFCEQIFRPDNVFLRYCSPLCRNKAMYAKKRLKIGKRWTKQRVCRVCGAAFLALKKSIRALCSPACVKSHYQVLRAQAKQRRRARLRGCRVEPYFRKDIFERDSWVCGICNKPVDRSKIVPHPDAPTLDHVIALANGGADAPDNVQCAHFLCNALKSDDITVLF